jgi:hypothetical protein
MPRGLLSAGEAGEAGAVSAPAAVLASYRRPPPFKVKHDLTKMTQERKFEAVSEVYTSVNQTIFC